MKNITFKNKGLEEEAAMGWRLCDYDFLTKLAEHKREVESKIELTVEIYQYLFGLHKERNSIMVVNDEYEKRVFATMLGDKWDAKEWHKALSSHGKEYDSSRKEIKDKGIRLLHHQLYTFCLAMS